MPPRCTTTRCVETVPDIEKIEKTVEVHQLQFSDQVVDVPVGMQDSCVRFRRVGDVKLTQVQHIDNIVLTVMQ